MIKKIYIKEEKNQINELQQKRNWVTLATGEIGVFDFDWNVWGHCTQLDAPTQKNLKSTKIRNARNARNPLIEGIFGIFGIFGGHSLNYLCSALLPCFHCTRYFSHVFLHFFCFFGCCCLLGWHSFVTFQLEFCLVFGSQIAANTSHLTLAMHAPTFSLNGMPINRQKCVVPSPLFH